MKSRVLAAAALVAAIPASAHAMSAPPFTFNVSYSIAIAGPINAVCTVMDSHPWVIGNGTAQLAGSPDGSTVRGTVTIGVYMTTNHKPSEVTKYHCDLEDANFRPLDRSNLAANSILAQDGSP